MSYDCKVQHKPSQPVLSIRTRTAVQDLSNVLGQCYMKIMQHLGEMGEVPAYAPFVTYYNMDMQDLDIEVGYPVGRLLPGKGDIQANTIPEGQVATCLYTGPYQNIDPAYNELAAFGQQNGLEFTGVCYEFYLNEPGKVPEDQLQTQIVFPIRS